MAEYTPTIGLEVHAELKTKTKLFCDSKNDPDETRPNVNVCPVCMGYPGTLPVINREAMKHLVRIGLAISGTIADTTYFDRKNYFYPDIPKGYQISQYKHPIVSGGELAGVAVTRVHLEEDTARSQHAEGMSLIDFNRAGLPLMELVTEPVVRDAEEAGRFARELQLLLRSLGAGDANMEKGEMRVEANVSVSKSEQKGTKVEVKNLNSFRAVERAIAYEIERQTKLLRRGEQVVQETRGWDEGKQQTFSQRKKEEAHDYRYFPEPDLPMFLLSELFDVETLRSTLPELPWERRQRYVETHGLKQEDANMFVASTIYGDLFEAVAQELGGDARLVSLAANYIASDVVGLGKEVGIAAEGKFFPTTKFAKSFAALMHMLVDGDLSSRGAKEVLRTMYEKGGDPKKIAQEQGLMQQSDTASLAQTVEQVVAEHQGVADEYRAGKEAALQFLVGQGMKLSKGAANPEVLKQLLIEKLK